MSLIAELKRRNVFRVGMAYAIVAWLLIEVTSVVLPALHLPDWALTLLVVFVVAGFPLALIVAWAFELTPEGIKRESAVDSDEVVTRTKGRKLDFAIIGLLAIALIFVVVDNYVLEDEPVPVESTAEAIPSSETEIHIGDIISYKYEDMVLIHRVIELGKDSSGWYAITKGDNLDYNDPEKVRFNQVKGIVIGILY